MLQCVAVCCSAVCCSVLQCVVVCCIAVHCGMCMPDLNERWGAGVETQKNVRGEIGGWGPVPFNEPYATLLSTIYDGA